MKRLLGIALAVLSIGFVAPAAANAAESNQNGTVTVAANSAPHWQRNRNGRRWGNRRRSVTRTRLVRHGRRLYRETYVVTYWPNGRTDTRLISRTRVS